ncbi:MAG: 4Fe-4S binding domain [Clostridiaceae bacterium]|nr:4Fe-4S binding domain [Clostridiaceae bacterium]
MQEIQVATVIAVKVVQIYVKTWYPVIDYKLCKECGTCYNKCKHGVYKKDKK